MAMLQSAAFAVVCLVQQDHERAYRGGARR